MNVIIKLTNETNASRKGSRAYISTLICAVVFFVLLTLRDVHSVGINKNIFIVITGFCALTLKTNHLIYLFCFLFPLYVGLPGNYMTLILIIRLILENYRFKTSTFAISMLIAGYMFLQNLITGYTGIVPMMFIAGVILVLLLFSGKYKLDTVALVFMYSAGVAALGYIMLASTLNVYDFTELLSTSFRLGSSSVDYVAQGVMNVSVDPNFYGMFSICAISLAFPLAFQPKTKPLIRICLCLFIIVQIVVCLIGLSRTFILIFFAWIILYLVSQKNIKGTVIALIAVIVIVALVANYMPDVVEAVLDRFSDSDISTGNGRIRLITEFWNEWSSSIITFLFGIGLFNCNVHCMPLQFLFGGGLILFVLMVALFFSCKNFSRTKIPFSESLPFIVTFLMMCTVPAAGLLNYMFPLVLIGLITQNRKANDEGKII